MTALSTMLEASLVADALALPVHWIYDPAQIEARFGRVTELLAPSESSYHASQPKGGQTHYGAQALVLMDAITEAGQFDPAVFSTHWRAMWQPGGYTGYRDGATKETLANLDAGQPIADAGSRSSDLGGAARIAPLIVATAKQPEASAVEAAWVETNMTHRDPAVAEAAAFLVRAVRAALSGKTVPEAIAVAADAEYVALPVKTHLDAAKAALKDGPHAAVQALGLPCPVQASFPSTLALALAFPDDLEGALIANAMAGGDSAARGLSLGMLLGAAPGAKVPDRWLAGWVARPRVEAFLKRFDA